MSIFSYPRINVKGVILIDVATANNDDYSGVRFPCGTPPLGGMPLRLADSNAVQALTYGLTDAEWIAWVQQPHTFVKPQPQGRTAAGPAGIQAVYTKAEGVREAPAQQGTVQETYIPAEWNYYGSMSLTMQDVQVIGVQYEDRLASTPAEDPLVGATLSFKNRPGDMGRSTGLLIDVNPEDVPCSQVFANSLLLEADARAIMLGKPSKAVTRWINFQRNAGLNGPNGAACCFQCTIPLEELQGQPILDVMAQGGPLPPTFKGMVFRYIVYRPLQEINVFRFQGEAWFREMVALYQKQGVNPDIAEIVGTLGPWYEGEMQSVPVGRLLNTTAKSFPLPPGSRSNGTNFFLAPAVFQVSRERGLVSVDFSGTFPEKYGNPEFKPLPPTLNPKYDALGTVRLVVRKDAQVHDFGPVPYDDSAGGDRKGWVFDFSIKDLPEPVLDLIDAGSFALNHSTYGDLLAESDDFLASDQSCLFGEQGGPCSVTQEFMNQGPVPEPATVRVFRRGRELTAAECPDITVWEYDTTPNQRPGQRRKLTTTYKPGQPLTVCCDRPGNRLYTFTLPGQPDPPLAYGGLNLMTAPQINLRLLPNDKDYSEYYKDPQAPEPIGNEKLTFDVLFREVLHNYYLLYPAMNQLIPLNDPQQWADPEMAGRMMQRTQQSWWDRAEYMPRTRDLSRSRRQLLHAWCLKFLRPDA
jgi:hypothetical protein